ncbi:hypothetical protein BDZ89DRAFT_1061845, partial [Hymenopellis radicata]
TIVTPAALTTVRQPPGCASGSRLCAGPAAAVFATAADDDSEDATTGNDDETRM